MTSMITDTIDFDMFGRFLDTIPEKSLYQFFHQTLDAICDDGGGQLFNFDFSQFDNFLQTITEPRVPISKEEIKRFVEFCAKFIEENFNDLNAIINEQAALSPNAKSIFTECAEIRRSELFCAITRRIRTQVSELRSFDWRITLPLCSSVWNIAANRGDSINQNHCLLQPMLRLDLVISDRCVHHVRRILSFDLTVSDVGALIDTLEAAKVDFRKTLATLSIIGGESEIRNSI